MKILIATPLYPPDIGGPATYAKLMNDRLPEYGFKIEILPFREVIKWPRIIRHFVYLLKILKRAKNVDVIFAQDPVSTGFPSLVASKLLKKKIVVRVAGDYAWEQGQNRFGVTDDIDKFQSNSYGWRIELMRKIQKFVVSSINKVIAPSKYFERLVSSWNKKATVVCIYNGIELPEIVQWSEREKNLIFSAGRLVPWKGFDILIELMKDLPGEWKLVIAGEGPERPRLEKLITELNLDDRVRLLGAVSRHTVFDYLSRATVFVLNTFFESFSFQVMEAMSAGVPVITTDVGNLPELIDNEKDGILVAPNDKVALKAAIFKLSVNHVFKDRIVAQAKIKARQFSIQSTLYKLSDLLKNV